ncbi:MAG: tetratricopeptide repeat protein [Deltaproteobacteria bacterium]|nr:tetratricopeptide repeat protein [Deltaproteobacteria bacterium]NIS76404.1 tetratricopeptide repeat protein [Deltaproteobacteria bacterium]
MRRFAVTGGIVFFLVFAVVGCKEKSRPPAGPPASGFVDLNKYREAETLVKLLEKDPNNRRAWIRLGNIYFDTAQNEEAVVAYRKALDFEPGNADVRTDMGICLRRLGRTDEAIEAFKKSTVSNPRHYQSRYNLGLTLLHDKNDLQGAIDAWEGLLRAVPDFPGRERLALQVENLKQAKPLAETENQEQR